MSPKKIAAPLDIYVRVSDTRGRSGESFISPQDQEERCRALAQARGYDVGEVFTDLDVSGGKMTRPALDEAIRRIEEGVSAGIIVAKLDRFARTLVGGLQTLEQINDLGGAVIVADGEFDTSTATGELVLNMMLSLAQFELRRIRETWASSKSHAVDRGVHISARVVPGYIRGDDRRLVPDPATADTIREAYRMAASGEAPARIAEYMSANGVPMLSNRVRRLLANRVYLGEARSGHGDVNPNAHEALVPLVVWNQAQSKSDRPAVTGRADNLLAGLVRCASCSFSMRSQKPRGNTVGSYRCGVQSGDGRCSHPSTVSALRLEEYVLEQFLSREPLTGERVPVDDEEALELARAAEQAEQSYRAALTDASLRQTIGDDDHARMVESLHAAWQDALAAVPAPQPRKPEVEPADLPALVAELQRRDDTAGLRELLAADIQAVFVRPAASRARNLPIADRVRIVWQDEPALELPRRGERFEPVSYAW